jgi:hypothetical protein
MWRNFFTVSSLTYSAGWLDAQRANAATVVDDEATATAKRTFEEMIQEQTDNEKSQRRKLEMQRGQHLDSVQSQSFTLSRLLANTIAVTERRGAPPTQHVLARAPVPSSRSYIPNTHMFVAQTNAVRKELSKLTKPSGGV